MAEKVVREGGRSVDWGCPKSSKRTRDGRGRALRESGFGATRTAER